MLYRSGGIIQTTNAIIKHLLLSHALPNRQPHSSPHKSSSNTIILPLNSTRSCSDIVPFLFPCAFPSPFSDTKPSTIQKNGTSSFFNSFTVAATISLQASYTFLSYNFNSCSSERSSFFEESTCPPSAPRTLSSFFLPSSRPASRFFSSSRPDHHCRSCACCVVMRCRTLCTNSGFDAVCPVTCRRAGAQVVIVAGWQAGGVYVFLAPGVRDDGLGAGVGSGGGR